MFINIWVVELAVMRKCATAGPNTANKWLQFDVYGLSATWVLFTISKLSHYMYILLTFMNKYAYIILAE